MMASTSRPMPRVDDFLLPRTEGVETEDLPQGAADIPEPVEPAGVIGERAFAG